MIMAFSTRERDRCDAGRRWAIREKIVAWQSRRYFKKIVVFLFLPSLCKIPFDSETILFVTTEARKLNIFEGPILFFSLCGHWLPDAVSGEPSNETIPKNEFERPWPPSAYCQCVLICKRTVNQND